MCFLNEKVRKAKTAPTWLSNQLYLMITSGKPYHTSVQLKQELLNETKDA